MTHPFTPGPNEEDLHSLTRFLLACFDKLDALKHQGGPAPERLPDTARTGGTVHQTSWHAGKLLAQAALSDAATTADGREAIAVLRHLTEATTSAAARAADSISALAHGDTDSSERLLAQARAHLAKTPVAVQDVTAALLRHDGVLHAQEQAARLGLGADTVKVSEAQRKALASLARGDGVIRRSSTGIREVTSPLAAHHLRATTIDALVDRQLVALTPLPQDDRYGIRLTPAGIQALLSARPVPRRSAVVTSPVPATPRSTARPASSRR
ncbi:hypothetical protein [Streptomyces sp. NPDC058084]|uniref:hypothetical protein n=1 Tax=Streptomyces sp. NPDC058084 TaxID=3346333 RepID=UPI0036E4D02B